MPPVADTELKALDAILKEVLAVHAPVRAAEQSSELDIDTFEKAVKGIHRLTTIAALQVLEEHSVIIEDSAGKALLMEHRSADSTL